MEEYFKILFQVLDQTEVLKKWGEVNKNTKYSITKLFDIIKTLLGEFANEEKLIMSF